MALINRSEFTLYACSDLHIDFMSEEAREQLVFPEADVYLIAGDTMNGVKQHLCQWLIEKTQGKPTYLIPGNHEYYGLRRDKAMRRLAQYFEGSNIRALLNSHEEIVKGLSVYGTDLWTDMGLHGEVTKASQLARSRMNDYKAITYKNGSNFRKLRPENTIAWHIDAKRKIKEFSDECYHKYILMTHHGLFKECLPMNVAGLRCRDELDPIYTSDGAAFLSGLNNKPLICINGHMHHQSVEVVQGVPVYANPRGYKGAISHNVFNLIYENDCWSVTAPSSIEF